MSLLRTNNTSQDELLNNGDLFTKHVVFKETFNNNN